MDTVPAVVFCLFVGFPFWCIADDCQVFYTAVADTSWPDIAQSVCFAPLLVERNSEWYVNGQLAALSCGASVPLHIHLAWLPSPIAEVSAKLAAAD